MSANNTVMPVLMNGDKQRKSKTKGISKHPLYLVRRAMIHRCYNPKVNCYHNYGGRGIKVCDEWLNNQEGFISFCELNGWERGLVLDRIDNDGNYEPSNIKFSTPKESSRNTRTNVWITIDGITKIKSDWCDDYGMPRKAVDSRLKMGWTIEDALTIPIFKVGEGRDKRALSHSEIVEIRIKHSNGVNRPTLAREYNMSLGRIDRITKRKLQKYNTLI